MVAEGIIKIFYLIAWRYIKINISLFKYFPFYKKSIYLYLQYVCIYNVSFDNKLFSSVAHRHFFRQTEKYFEQF